MKHMTSLKLLYGILTKKFPKCSTSKYNNVSFKNHMLTQHIQKHSAYFFIKDNSRIKSKITSTCLSMLVQYTVLTTISFSSSDCTP